MINIIKREPIIKKSILTLIISMIAIFSLFTIFQYNNLEKIYLDQVKINQRLVGILVEKYPDQEADIVSAIFKQDNSKLDLGINTLDKYGYNKSYPMYENVNFQEHLKYFLVNNFVVFVAIIMIMSVIVFNLIKNIYGKLSKVNNDIESIINNNHIIEDDFKEEGIFNRIYTDLSKLSRSLNLKLRDLDREKESITEKVTI